MIRTIYDIESSMPPLCGPGTDLEEYLNHRVSILSNLYEKYNRDAQKARAEDYWHIAHSLLKMIRGSIGDQRKEGEKVIIEVGLGRLSARTGRPSTVIAAFQRSHHEHSQTLLFQVPENKISQEKAILSFADLLSESILHKATKQNVAFEGKMGVISISDP